MRIMNAKIFDDIIAGTSATWLSGAEFNKAIGQADMFGLQAVTTGVLGVNPTLTISSEYSSDSQNWVVSGEVEIDNTIVENTSYAGTFNFFVAVFPLAYVRFRIALGGTNPRCRLKLYVTGRACAVTGS